MVHLLPTSTPAAAFANGHKPPRHHKNDSLVDYSFKIFSGEKLAKTSTQLTGVFEWRNEDRKTLIRIVTSIGDEFQGDLVASGCEVVRQ